MKRRDFLSLMIVGCASAPVAALAQENDRVRHIGFFGAGINNPVTAIASQAFLEQMRKLGFAEGKNLVVEWQSTDQQPAGLRQAVAKMVRSGAELIVSSGPEAALQACLSGAPTLPIVMIAINYDPLARGYIQSLANPGGRVTGVMLRQPELAAKQVELLIESFPQRKKLALIWDNVSADQFVVAEQRAKAMGLEVLSLQLRAAPHDFDKVFKELMSNGAEMALFLSSPSFAVQSTHIGELAARTPLPTMFIFRGYVATGGLVSYGAEIKDMYRQAATQAARILRGANPADLPVEQPQAFELTVNLKTAKAIGLELPTSLLLRATEVIE